MLYTSLAFLAGICLFQFCSDFPAAGWWGLLVGVPFSLHSSPALRLTGIAIAGFLWAWWHASQLSGVELPANLEGRDILVRGIVKGLPEQLDEDKVRFRFQVTGYRDDGYWHQLDMDTRLSWYRQAPDLQPGAHWQLLVRLRQPRGFANPGGFDLERWLFARGIRASGYVRKSRENQQAASSEFAPFQEFRHYLSTYIRQLGIPPPMQALLRALGVGDRSGMSSQQWQVLQNTGTSHLLAISGLHVGLVAGLVFFAARRTWCLFGNPQGWPAPRFAAVCAMLATLVYALLAGFQVPAQRALVMVWVWMLAILWTGNPHPWRVWSIALWIVLLLEPLSVLTAGFWLSFGAVALILILTVGRSGPQGRIKRVVTVQFGLVLGLTPLLWLWFQQISVTAPATNLIAIPWVGMLVVPLLLLGLLFAPLLPAATTWLLERAADLLSLLWWLLEQIAALPVNLWQAPAVPAPWIMLVALALACLLLPGSMSLRLAGTALLFPVFLLQAERPDSGDLWLTLLDVGQGLSVVLETRHHVLVYDTGPSFSSGFNAGSAVLVPFLVHRGYRHIDRLVVSHADNDHVGGAESLFEKLDVHSIHSGEPARIEWARARQCHAGQQWYWDKVRFEYLAPFEQAKGNDGSCVLRIETGQGRVVLLPGDVERNVEQQLVRRHRQRLLTDILVAPHHGSRTSSTREFVEATKPAYVLFPVGYHNRFGFPRPEVVTRYRSVGARLLNSAASGAIQFRIEADQPLQALPYRHLERRYWKSKT